MPVLGGCGFTGGMTTGTAGCWRQETVVPISTSTPGGTQGGVASGVDVARGVGVALGTGVGVERMTVQLTKHSSDGGGVQLLWHPLDGGTVGVGVGVAH